MNRRDCFALPLLLAGCGGDVEYEIQPSPIQKTGKNVFASGLEGLWTPTLSFDGVSTGISYSIQRGFYLKFGRWVMLLGDIHLSSKGSAAGTAKIGGIPFKGVSFSGVAPRAVQPIGEWGTLATNWVFISLKMDIVSLDRLTLVGANAASSSIGSDLQNTDFNNTSNINFYYVYITEGS